jgi:cytochrome c553
MSRIAFALMVFLLGLACTQAVRADEDLGDLDDRAARAIVATRCYSCHGISGLSTTEQFPKLAGQNVEYLTKQMFNFQSGARRSVIMEEQMAGLGGHEIELLARYYSRQKIRPDRVAKGRASELGERIFRDGNKSTGVAPCQTCHGPQAYGAQMLPRLAGQHAAYLERQLRAFLNRTRANDKATMHIVARGLTEPEIKAVALYLSGLE